MIDPVDIYIDGSARNKDKANGGYGIICYYKGMIKRYCDGSYQKVTSDRMEVLALLRTLQEIKKNFYINIYSDNQYVVNAIKKGWIWKWQNEGFHRRKNGDMWSKILDQYLLFPENCVNLHWIRGHSGIKGNEEADDLAKYAGKELKNKKLIL